MNEGLATLDKETLKAPVSRAKNASGIRQRIAQLKKADAERSKRRRVIQTVIDGAQPYDQVKLDGNGEGERTNFSQREGEGMADAAKTPFFTLRFRNPRFLTIKCKYGDNPERNHEWSEIISGEWSQLLSDWNGHSFHAQLCDLQMCVYGVGLPVWEDGTNPFWCARKMSEVLVPDQAPADIDQLDEAVILRRKSPVGLYKFIRNEKAAKAMGWFPDRVKQAIVKHPGVGNARSTYGENWGEEWQASLRRGDVLWNSEDFQIPLADHFIKEFSGKITRSIMYDHDDGRSGSNPFKEDEDDAGLLYRKEEEYESFDQILQPFFWDIGSGEWHSIKGLGPKISDFCQVSDRTMCRMIDGATASTGLVLEAGDDSAGQKTQLVHFGNGVIVQPGYKVAQTRFAEHLEGVLAVKQDLRNTLSNNTGQYRSRAVNDNFEPTLGQAQLNYQNAGQLSEAAIDRFMPPLDRLYREQVRRGLSPRLSKTDPGGKEAHAFRERCIARGVPAEALDFKNIVSVRAVRGFGNGSPVGMDMATRAMMELIPYAQEPGRNLILRNRTAFVQGPENVDAVFPPYNQEGAPNDQMALATLENNALRMPDGQVLVEPRQDHVVHFTVCFADVAKHIEQMKAGQADPKLVFVHLNQAGPHLMAHMNMLSGDPTRKEQLKTMQMAWLTLSKMADQLRQQLEEAAKSQEANPPQPQLDPKLIAMMAKVHGELGIKRDKMVGEAQLKREKQDALLQLKDLEKAHEIQMKNMDLSAAA